MVSGNTRVRFNLTWDFGKRSFKGCTFAEVKAVPALGQWILSRPEPTGQMAQLVAYLKEANEATATRPAAARDIARAVYRLTPDGSEQRAIVDAEDMAALVKSHSLEHAMAGGLRCEQGHRMKFVPAYSYTTAKGEVQVRAHFSHIVAPTSTACDCGGGGGGNNGGVGPGGCSDAHLLATRLLVKNVRRIQLKRFKECGECVEFAFGPNSRATAKEEVHDFNNAGRRIRSDVAVYEKGVRVMTLEVKKAHATNPASRAGVPYLEVNAGHVLTMLANASSADTSTVRLNCENVDSPCTRGCAVRRAKETAARSKWKRKFTDLRDLSEDSCCLCENSPGEMYAGSDIWMPCPGCSGAYDD